MVVVDTSVWIDYLNGTSTQHTDWFDAQLTQRRFGVLDLMVCEILQGVPSDKAAALVLKHLKRFEIGSTGGADLAIAAASNYRALRTRGHTIRKTIDCLIATYCIREGCSLLHTDRDFDPFEEWLGLSVVHPNVLR